MRTLLLMGLVGGCNGPTEVATPPPMDADGDGFDAAIDCDDTDPTVFPGSVDFWNDDLDADCDDEDGRVVDFTDLPVDLELSNGLETVVACGRGGSDVDDLLVMSLRDATRSRFLLFQGPLEAGTLQRSEAVAQFEFGRTGLVDVECVDVDADGRDDVVALFDTTASDALGGVYVFSQPETGFDGDYSLPEAVLLRMPDRDVGPVSALAVAHLDGDGIEDLVVTRRFGTDLANSEGWYLVSGTLTDGSIAAVATARGTPGTVAWYTDLDGDGVSEEIACDDLACVAFDQGAFDGSPAGARVGYVSAGSSPFGPYANGDFDGDGAADDLVGLSEAGLAFHLDAWDAFVDSGSVGPSFTIPFPFGNGRSLETVGDQDGDGADDVLVWSWSPELTERRLMSGRVGALTLDLDAATLLKVDRDLLQFGDQAAGDFDGDGRVDLALTGFGSGIDKVLGVHLSSLAPLVEPIPVPVPTEPPTPPAACDLAAVQGVWERTTPVQGADLRDILTISAPTGSPGQVVGTLQTGRIFLNCDFVVECAPAAGATRVFRRYNTVVDDCYEGWMDLTVAGETLTAELSLAPGGPPIDTLVMELQ